MSSKKNRRCADCGALSRGVRCQPCRTAFERAQAARRRASGRFCSVCKVSKPDAEFESLQTPGKLCATCKTCRRRELARQRRARGEDLEYRICTKCGLAKPEEEFAPALEGEAPYRMCRRCREINRDLKRKHRSEQHDAPAIVIRTFVYPLTLSSILCPLEAPCPA